MLQGKLGICALDIAKVAGLYDSRDLLKTRSPTPTTCTLCLAHVARHSTNRGVDGTLRHGAVKNMILHAMQNPYDPAFYDAYCWLVGFRLGCATCPRFWPSSPRSRSGVFE